MTLLFLRRRFDGLAEFRIGLQELIQLLLPLLRSAKGHILQALCHHALMPLGAFANGDVLSQDCQHLLQENAAHEVLECRHLVDVALEAPLSRRSFSAKVDDLDLIKAHLHANTFNVIFPGAVSNLMELIVPLDA